MRSSAAGAHDSRPTRWPSSAPKPWSGGSATQRRSFLRKSEAPCPPWKEIIGFRIVVHHAYHRLDYRRVWNTLCEDIPNLRAAIEQYRG
jgi:Protein of unknown function DUF86